MLDIPCNKARFPNKYFNLRNIGTEKSENIAKPRGTFLVNNGFITPFNLISEKLSKKYIIIVTYRS